METITKTIRHKQICDKKSLQFTLDRDINVPEQLGDISRIITQNGSLCITESKTMGDKIYVSGTLSYQVLYYTDETESKLAGLNGELPFDEMIRISESDEGHINVSAKLEDIQINIIHPRKIGINSLITLTPVCSKENECQMITGISEDPCIECLYTDKDLNSVIYSADDKVCINEELEINSNSPNIGSILYYSYVLSDFDCETRDNCCDIYGTLSLFILYSGEDADNPYYIIQEEIPFEKQIEVNDADGSCVCYTNPCINKVSLSARPNEDGEMRIIGVNAEISCDSDIFREEKSLILEDAYAVGGELSIEKATEPVSEIVGLETEIIKITEKIEGTALAETLGDIIHTDATVDIDDINCSDDSIHVAGTICFSVVYKNLQNLGQLEVYKKDIEFMETLPLKNLNNYDSEKLHISLSAIPLGSNLKPVSGGDYEARCDLKISYLVTADGSMEYITDIELNSCCGKCKKQITCYFVKEGDTLFSIGKKYGVKQSDIEKWNSDLSLTPGSRLFMYTCKKN